MKPKYLLLFFIFVLLAALLSACAGGAYYGSSSWPGVTATEEVVFLANGPQVYAIQLSNGAEIWRFPEKPNNAVTFYAAPVLTPDGQLLVAGYDKKLYSLNPASGAVNWTFEGAKNRYIASPLVAQETIFAPSADGKLYALDLHGKVLWTFKTDKPLWATPVADTDCQCLFLPSMDHHVYAIEAAKGNLIWKSPDLGGAIVGSPAYGEDDTIFVGTFGKEVLALNAKNGVVRWRFATTNWVWSGPILADGRLYVGDMAGYFYAVAADTGALVWQFEADGPIASSPLVLNGQIYFTTETGSLYAFTPEGNTVWTRVIGKGLYAAPVAAGESILVAPLQGDFMLTSLTLKGDQQWHFTPEKK